MRNLKKVLCLGLVLSMILAVVSGAAYYTNYADDDKITSVNESYLLAAELLQDIGVVVGKTDYETKTTVYDPQGDFDRASLARVLYVLHTGFAETDIYNQGLVFDSIVCPFTDIDGCWASGYIKYGYAMGYLSGKGDNRFDPYSKVNAQEMATALLAVIGYQKADLSKDWPNNVLKYGYVKLGNLFTTGLSNNSVDVSISGLHVVGYTTGKAVEAEKELKLAETLNREQAFFMMYKAIVYRNVVTKENILQQNGDYYADVLVEDVEYTQDGPITFSYPTNYLYYKFGVTYEEWGFDDIVAGTKSYSFCENDYVTEDGYVYLEDEGYVRDFGYTAAVKLADAQSGTGFTLSHTDWDAQIGRAISGRLTYWYDETGHIESDEYITYYQFDYQMDGTTKTGFVGTDLAITKETKIESVDSDTIKIGGKSYDMLDGEGAHLITNYWIGEWYSTDDLVNEISDAVNQNSADALLFKLIDGEIYGVIELQTIFAEVTDVKTDGTIEVDNDPDEYYKTVIEGVKKGDRILYYYDPRDDAFHGTIATKLEKQNVVVTKNADGTVKSVNYETAAGTQIKVGAYHDLNSSWDVDYIENFALTDFTVHEDAYWDLWVVGNYVYEIANWAKTKTVDVTITGKTVVGNTSNGTTTFNFTMKDTATGKLVYSFSATVQSGSDAYNAYTALAINDTADYTYDQKTNVGISLVDNN